MNTGHRTHDDPYRHDGINNVYDDEVLVDRHHTFNNQINHEHQRNNNYQKKRN